MTVGGVLRVGVTGHRHLAGQADVEHEVDRVLDRLVTEHSSPDLVVLSSLAEGADRLVVERVLARDRSALHAVLPLPPEDYSDDFADPASREGFARYLDAAEQVTLSPPQESREAAYEHAGREVLARCDVLLALWDGRPARGRGGTGQLVAEALHLGRHVEVVDVPRPSPVGRSPDAPVP